MSTREMFKNFHKNSAIPDNEKTFVECEPEYHDIIVLGGDNMHTFKIPFDTELLSRFVITYKQGTEIKLELEYVMSKFVPIDTESGAQFLVFEYPDDGAKLFVYVNGPVEEGYEDIYCLLYYPVSAQDSLMFNNFNKEVQVQLRAFLKINDEEIFEPIIQYSRKFKIKVIDSLQKGISNN